MNEDLLSMQSKAIAFDLLVLHLTAIEGLSDSKEVKYELIKEFVLAVKQ